jgi:glycosyltransferase involved in cell wall biosynthesis
LRIAQVAPLAEAVPPPSYGGTERVVSYLTEELVRRGHDVTLFASADSITSARLISCCGRSLRLSPDVVDTVAHHLVMFERLAEHADEFDIIHFHADYLHFPVTRREGWPHVTTLHGRLDLTDLQAVYDEFGEMPVISISHDQRRPLPQANWVGTVHHGLPRDLFRFSDAADPYLAFLGRISPEKRVDRAIEIAGRVGMPLRIAAKIDDADRAYFEAEIAHMFRLPHVEYLGEIGGEEKARFLSRASVLLFPIDWAEPFGLVMIEAMACGTPVVAWRAGSVPEVITHGVSGLIVEDMDEAVRATIQAIDMDRRACRGEFERRFTVERMAADYLEIYQRIASGVRESPAGPAVEEAV